MAMLTEIYIEALLVDEELADQVWEAWDKGEIDDRTAWLAWWLITLTVRTFRRSRRIKKQHITTKANLAKARDAKPRVLASSEKPRMTPRRTQDRRAAD